jgi:hypothetical protein
MLEAGGWDTHEKQVDSGDHTRGTHANLLKDLNDSIMSFMKTMDASGDSDRVMIMTFSEFGRRIASTASGGTDHGTAAPMLIIGNKLNSNVLGKNPVISPTTQWSDNLVAEFDFRQVYASIIEQWLGSDDTTENQVLRGSFSKLPITGQYLDADGDGVYDKDDLCNDTPAGAIVDANGCQVFSLPAEAFSVTVVSASCIGQNTGSIRLSSSLTNYKFGISVNGSLSGELNSSNNHSHIITGLSAGTYEVCFSVDGVENYKRCYSVKVNEPPSLNAVATVSSQRKQLNLELSGSKFYKVLLNGKQLTAVGSIITLPLKVGMNTVEVTGDLECQGRFYQEVFISEEVKIFPNPTDGPITMYIHGVDNEALIKISSITGTLLSSFRKKVPSDRRVDINLSSLKMGVYILSIDGPTTRVSQKIIKQ